MTDFSWAAINALCRSFNNIGFKEYLDKCYEIIVNKDHGLLQYLTTIKLCSSHLTKNMKNDVVKHFKKDDISQVASLIGGLFNLISFEDIDKYIKNFLIILISEYETPECKNAKEEFVKFSQDDENWMMTGNEESSEEDEELDFQEFHTIFKNSKFFQYYASFISSSSQPQSKKSSLKKNKLFNDKFAAVLLKKYIAYLPLWSCILTAIRSAKVERTNNGMVEGNIVAYIFFN